MRSIVGHEESNRSSLRFLIENRCFSPRTLDDDDADEDRSSPCFSYQKLPQPQLKLSVLKLDGSLFDVYVRRNATVAELRQAIEEVFSYSPKEAQGKISWSHVWSHFCLCYEGEKLVNDNVCVRNLGIKDGDQLRFIRHLAINYSPLKRSKNRVHCQSKEYSRFLLESNAYEEKERVGPDDSGENENHENSFKYFSHEDHEDLPMPEFKLAHFLRGWLSYSRLYGVTRKASVSRSRPSRFSLQRLGGQPRMINH